MTYILGISAFYHDSAAALIKDNVIIAAAQEERFTRIKHDSNFPANAVNFCLKSAGISTNDIDAVIYYEKPFIKFERILETALAFAPKSLMSFIKSMPVWLNKKLFIPREIDKHFNKELTCPIYFCSHHESHAASAFFPSPFEDAAIICLDGVGEWTSTSWGIGKGNKIELKQNIEFPHSLGLLYSAMTGYLGFKVNSGEYKVMGLAPYGEPKYVNLILENLIDLKDDGSFLLNQKYFDYCCGDYMTNSNFHKLFGKEPREAESILTQEDMDLARSIQEVTELIISKIAYHVYKKTKLKNLCLAGGCALNCVANGKLLREGPFENIWIQPAAGDAGGALGAAFIASFHIFNNKRIISQTDTQQGSLLGCKFNSFQTKQCLDKYNASYIQYDSKEELRRKIAEFIAEGKIVGRFAGRMEFGPRALGNRSILADPRNKEMQKRLNLAIKKRESFRPFAPSCHEEDAHLYFEIDKNKNSPYMLLTMPINSNIRKELSEEDTNLSGIDKLKADRSLLPAITHVNCSARLQTVNKNTNEDYWYIIEEFKKLTGYPVIVNTSFNIRGEPLVNTPEDAYKCFMYTDMDVLAIGDFILLKENQPELKGIEEYHKQFKLD